MRVLMGHLTFDVRSVLTSNVRQAIMDLNKLTLKSQEALQGAQQISQAQQQNVVDVLHLLYVLLGQAESIVPTIINKLEIDNKKLKEKVFSEIEKIPKVTGAPQFYLSSEMANVLQEGFKQAQNLGDEFISTEHLFLALLVQESKLPNVLIGTLCILRHSTAKFSIRLR